MAGQINLNRNQLRAFAPDSAILAFRPEDTGSPMQDWCNHLSQNTRYRRELEEFAVLGDVVVRIADGIEPAPLERVKILSLEYAVKVLNNETDAKEFVRAARAIAGADAAQFEFEQIAAHYYGEIRRGAAINEVLKEMALLGMQLEAVTKTVNEREIETSETEIEPQKLTVEDEKRVRAAQIDLFALAAPTTNFDDEIAAINSRLSGSRATRMVRDEYAEFYLGDAGKSLAELDRDFESFEQLEQYDENGIVGFAMSGGQHSVVVYELDQEVDASYLPTDAQSFAKEMNRLFVGHQIGGAAARKARQFVVAHRAAAHEINLAKKGLPSIAPAVPPIERFSTLPFSDDEFADWLAAKLDALYNRRVLRTVRRTTHHKGQLVEYATAQEINPDWEEMQYVANVCQILWQQMHADFHLRSLRRETYHNLYLSIRKTVDTARVAELKKTAYDYFKEQKKLSLKEFTALNTVAKSQEARLADTISPTTKETLREIETASPNRLRYLKFFLYNDANIQTLTRQEKQRLWAAIRTREATVSNNHAQPELQNQSGQQPAKATPNTAQIAAAKQQFIRNQNAAKQIVRVTTQNN